MSTAERRGKDPLIAAAMVRRQHSWTGKSRGTITLPLRRQKLASDGTVDSISELLDQVDIGEQLIYSSATFWENYGY